MNKNIAIVILNYIQFVNVKSAIDELINLGYNVDIYCERVETNDGFKELFEDNVNILINKGYKVYRNVLKKRKYKILLEPYPSMEIDAKYKIKYRYGTISAKPDIVYGYPQNFVVYDAILCSGNYDANYLSVFSKTYITGNMKYIGFEKKKEKRKKKVLLYLPTYGKCSSLDLIGDYLSNLRDKYYVVAKIHHGTSFLKDEIYRIDKIKNSVDEFYDLHKDLSELLAIADVVLTDNSGSIFEAIYTSTPVAVFSDDINQNKWGNFNTTQYELYKAGILPYTNKLEEIQSILKKAQSSKIRKLQNKWNNENFYHPDDQVADFVKVVKMYMNDEIDKRYFDFHTQFKKDYLNLVVNNNENIDNINNLKNEIVELKRQINIKDGELNDAHQTITTLTNAINYYKTGKLYKLANKIYKLKNGEK